MCEKREKRLDRSLPRSPRTRSASPPDARASPHAATWPVSGINSQLLREGLPSTEQCHTVANLDIRVRVTRAHPLHELVRGFHGGKARLPNQRPIVEHAGLLDVRQRLVFTPCGLVTPSQTVWRSRSRSSMEYTVGSVLAR